MEFKYSFQPSISIKPGVTCCWTEHFRDAPRDVIWYLDMRAKSSAIGNRFVWVYVDTIVAGLNKGRARLGKKPLSKSAVEKSLAYLEDLGLLMRIRRMRIRGAVHTAFVVADHDDACIPEGDMCRFMGGPDSGVALLTQRE